MYNERILFINEIFDYFRAMKFFQDKDLTGRGEQTDKELSSVHQNTITGIKILSNAGGKAKIVSTCGADSQIVLWNFQVSHTFKQLDKFSLYLNIKTIFIFSS